MDTNLIMQFCAKCKNKRADQQHGLICGLTGAVPNFQGSCPDYAEDPAVAKAMADAQAASPQSAQTPPTTGGGYSGGGQAMQDPQQMVKSSMRKMWVSVGVSIVLSIAAAIAFSYMYSSGTGMGGMNISFMPIVIGALVGLSLSFIGGGKGIWAGIIGLAVTLFSLVLTNVIMHVSIYSAMHDVSFMEAFKQMGVGGALKQAFSNMSTREYIYYGVAIVEGFGVSMGGSFFSGARRYLPI